MVMITILPGWRTSPSMSSGKGWHLVSLVMLQILGCASLYPAFLSTFPQIRSVNRAELSFSTLSQFCFHGETFPFFLGIRECPLGIDCTDEVTHRQTPEV